MMSPGAALTGQSRTGLGWIGSEMQRGTRVRANPGQEELVIAKLRNWPASGSGHQRRRQGLYRERSRSASTMPRVYRTPRIGPHGRACQTCELRSRFVND